MLPPDPVSILTQTEVVPLLLGLAGSLMTVYASLHCWELMLSMIISLGCTSPTILQSIAATNRSLCGGLFSVLAFAACGSLPFSQFFETGLLTGCLWASGVAALAICLPVTLLSTTFACRVMSRAVVSTRRVLMGAVGAWCVGSQQLGITCLVGMAYSMYHMSCTHCSCS